jgi:3-deoxy-D-manno-octulosonic-acid transferase
VNEVFLIYQILYIIFFLIYALILPFRKRRREGILMRLGLYPPEIINKFNEKANIWIHAVSVGEVMAARALADGIKKGLSGYNIVISTVTETGNKVAKASIGDAASIIYLPLDLTFAIKRAVKAISPAMFIIIETEIWPNLLRLLSKNNVPIILCNGRISKKSYRRYMLVKPVLKYILGYIDRYLMRTEEDRQRIISLGARGDRVTVLGNIKFDSVDSYVDEEQKRNVLRRLGLENRRLIVAGSTHPGEEKIILEAYSQILKRYKDVLLLIAPRHIERADDVVTLVKSYNFTPIKISNLTVNCQLSTVNCLVYILDTIGQLKLFYSLAWAVFVGGSLIRHGGQNMIEPACLAKPILFGPHTFNFEDEANAFLNNKAAILVKDATALAQNIEMLHKDDISARDMGKRAQEIVKANQGIVNNTVDVIKNIL